MYLKITAQLNIGDYLTTYNVSMTFDFGNKETNSLFVEEFFKLIGFGGFEGEISPQLYKHELAIIKSA